LRALRQRPAAPAAFPLARLGTALHEVVEEGAGSHVEGPGDEEQGADGGADAARLKHTVTLTSDEGAYFKDTVPGPAPGFTPTWTLGLTDYRTPVNLPGTRTVQGEFPEQPLHCTG